MITSYTHRMNCHQTVYVVCRHGWSSQGTSSCLVVLFSDVNFGNAPPTNSLHDIQGCDFYRWIDGHDKWDRRIMYFPYDPWKSVPHTEFVRWVPPPLDPPPMNALQKLLASVDRKQNPPRCHYGKVAVLQEPSQEGMFGPFFRCGQRGFVSVHSIIIPFSDVICVDDIITLWLRHYDL
jgi:hypothetical protein